MKTLRKVLLGLSLILLITSLFSCKNNEDANKFNKSTPMGNLNLDTVVASSGDLQVKNGLFYTRLRALGYDTVLNNLKKALFAEEIEQVRKEINLDNQEVTETEEDLFEYYAGQLFQNTDASVISAYTDKEIDKYIAKYIDTCNNNGITVTKEQLLKYQIKDEKITFSYIPQEVIEDQIITYGINLAAKKALEEIVDLERIENDKGTEVTNTNYISEDHIKNYFESTFSKYGTYQAIIIQFNNLTEAKEAIKKVEAKEGPLTDDNALKFYVELYNSYYNYREQLSTDNPFASKTQTEFLVDEDTDELGKISSSIKKIITETLDEDKQYLKQPFNKDNKYVMVYRGDTVYKVNKENGFENLNKQLKWTDLSDKETAKATVTKQIKAKLTENKISSYTSTILGKRIKAAEIEIYDPFFEYRFTTSYDEDYYKRIDPKKFDANNIFKVVYNDKTTTYSVENFYNDQSKKSALTIVVDLLKYEYAYQYRDRYYDKDDLDDMTEAVNDDIKKFQDGENSAYDKNIGTEVFMMVNYGYATKEDSIKYYKVANSTLSKYLVEYVFNEWALKDADGKYPENHAIDYNKLNALNNILKAGNAYYEDLFTIDINHVLIYIDDDSDGNPDDPQEFIKDFTAEQKTQFEQAYLALAQAIYAEANCEKLTASNDIMEILNYIVTAYSQNKALYSDPEKTWADYKKYNFLLKVETLGSTTQSSVNNYVENFANYVRKLYKVAKENDLEIEDEKAIFYFVESKESSPNSINDICATEYGYHMIVVNSYKTPSRTSKLEASDRNGYYKDITILLDEKETDTVDDNIYVIVPSLYNEKETEATIDQLFTYYVQLQKGVTSSLDSTVRSVLSDMFGDAITRYTSNQFQTYLLVKNLKITTSNDLLSKQLSNYIGYLKRYSQDYKTDDQFETWYDDTTNWARPY